MTVKFITPKIAAPKLQGDLLSAMLQIVGFRPPREKKKEDRDRLVYRILMRRKKNGYKTSDQKIFFAIVIALAIAFIWRFLFNEKRHPFENFSLFKIVGSLI